MLQIASWVGRSVARRTILRVVVVKLTLATAVAQDFSRQKEVLEEIRKTAADICYTIEQKGSGDTAQVSGEVQAQVNGLFAKLGELGIRGGAQLNSGQYQGVPWQDLASVLQRSQDCRRDVFDKLVDRLLPPSSSGTLQPPTTMPRPQVGEPPTQQSTQSMTIPAPGAARPMAPPTQPAMRSPTRQETLACELAREQVLDYERTHHQIGALERVNYADRCQNIEGMPPPDETLRIKQGTQQFMYCVHWRDEILQAEAPRSAYAQMLARDRYMWSTAYCDRTDPPLTTTR